MSGTACRPWPTLCALSWSRRPVCSNKGAARAASNVGAVAVPACRHFCTRAVRQEPRALALTSENWAAGMPDMFCSADAPWPDGITPRSISSHTRRYSASFLFASTLKKNCPRYSGTLADLTDSRAAPTKPLEFHFFHGIVVG